MDIIALPLPRTVAFRRKKRKKRWNLHWWTLPSKRHLQPPEKSSLGSTLLSTFTLAIPLWPLPETSALKTKKRKLI